jgi:hypothetical protein
MQLVVGVVLVTELHHHWLVAMVAVGQVATLEVLHLAQ